MPDSSEILVTQKADSEYEIRRGAEVLGVIVRNGDGWRACRMPGYRAFSPVGMDEFDRVRAYAVREISKEAA